MFISYVIKGRYGRYLVIYRQENGVYEVWREVSPKKHDFVDFDTTLANATGKAQQLAFEESRETHEHA